MFGEVEWFRAGTRVVYLIIDNLELIRSWSSAPTLLPVLFRLPELAQLPNLGLIFISTSPPLAYSSGTGIREPLSLCFTDYNDEQLSQILLSRHQQNSELYTAFLSAVLKPFSRATRRVTELAGLLEPLFEKYCEPVVSGNVRPDEQGKRRLFKMILPHVKGLMERASSILSPGASPRVEEIGSPGPGIASRDPLAVDELSDLQLPLCGKYLLISAYIASTNPATLDADLFEAGGGESRKRKQRSSLSAQEKRDKEMHDRQLKGPGSFSLERLLAIFSCIATSGTSSGFSNRSFQELGESDPIEVTADVLMQISTLVGVNLLAQGLTDPVEAPKFRCVVDEDVIAKVAKSINFPLSKYLYYNN